jgi:glycosyltransferase involved in cell wall biosynthesis
MVQRRVLLAQAANARAEAAARISPCHESQVPLASPALRSPSLRSLSSDRPLKLSVIVPVFNERATVAEALDAICAKSVPGWELEILIVESNSTDGTRDIVLGYRGRDRVKVVLEEAPRGKGRAVRTGLAQATGDVILIQDADLEYDLNDYDVLLVPLATGRQSFVLGSRHGQGGWAIRKFTDQPVQALVLNLAHWGFTLMINGALGIWLRDPFTMYKVFRRECLDGLSFECNRFDFDWELLIKLVRKGHRPIEIPISYKSRSFKEGKKISMFRDPLTWIWALLKYRFQPL